MSLSIHQFVPDAQSHGLVRSAKALPPGASCRIRYKLQIDERRLYRRVPQPARQVVDGDSVHQQVSCVAVTQRGGADPLPREIALSSSARFTAVLTQRHAVVVCASMILPWLMSP